MNNAILKKPFFLRFSKQEQVVFAKRLGMILRSGMPIMEGLHMFDAQQHSRSATYIYRSLITDVESGQLLSTGLEKFSALFGEFTINVVRTGERSGTLHENLDYLAEELKKKQALKKKVVSALIYPAIIVVVTIGISLVLTVYIFPKITPIFQSIKSELPFSTRALIVLSNFLLHKGVWVLGGMSLFAGGYMFLLRVPRFHLLIDSILLKLPLFGTLSRYYNIANFSRTLGLLLKSDMGIVESLAIVTKSSRNLAFRSVFVRVSDEVMKGQKISAQLSKYPRFFPHLFSQMVSAGEQTGNLSPSLIYLSDMYEEEINDLTKNLTTLVEPVLMVVMGIIVGFIAISIITPIYSVTQSISHFH